MFSQKSKSALITLINSDKADAAKVNHLNDLATEVMNSNPDTAIVLGLQEVEIISALYNVPGPELEEEIKTNQSPEAQNLKRLFINTFNNLGYCYRLKADYPNAFLYFTNGLLFAKELKDSGNISRYLGNIGVCYRLKGDYPKALDYFLEALKLDEARGNKAGTASRFGNIGSVYWNMGDYIKALDHYSKALKINEELGDKKGVATNLSNSGSVYYQQGDLNKALDSYLKALKMAEEVDYKQLQATTLGNIGSVYKDKKDYAGSLDCYLKAMKIAEELGDKNSFANQLGSIGTLYFESPELSAPEGETKKGFPLAAKYLNKALAVSTSIGAMDNVKGWYEQLSKLYEKSNVPLQDTIENKLLSLEQTHLRAIYYMKMYVAVRDTLFSEERKKQLKNKELDFVFEKKQALEKAEQEKKLAIAEADQRRQKIIIFIMSCVLLIVIGVAIFIFSALKKARKQKEETQE